MAAACIRLVRTSYIGGGYDTLRLTALVHPQETNEKSRFSNQPSLTHPFTAGVEDDGCHSLNDYEAVAESARVLGE